ncbi:hypothetical protein TRVL_08422 [Trypanosoma vivax]|nr:hypothetical protein TRVL_08422 [Trypanosoma vivax]
MSVSCLCIPMQCLCRFYAAKACQALLLCLMYAVLPVCLMSECKTVEVLSLMNTMAEVQISATAVVAGFNASLRSKRNQLGDHVNITVITPTLEEVHNVTYIEQFLSNSNESILRVVLGPLGSVPIKMLLPLLETYDVVAFGPISAGIAGRQRNQHLYFLTASPYADLMALIRYSLGYLRVQRLAFMYLRGFSFGEEEYALTVKALEHVGRKLSGVFVMDSSLEMPAPEHVFDKAWSQFAATRPQAVLLFGQACSDTLNFLERLLSDERTTNHVCACAQFYWVCCTPFLSS